MKDLRVTIIQSDLSWENKEKNLNHFSTLINSIREETDLIILPEMFTTGFTMNASSLAEYMNETSIDWMRKVAKEKNCTVTGSLIISESGKYFNRLIWMSQEGYVTYDKRHLFGLSNEGDTYSMGTQKIITTINEWKILPLICYDLRFPVWSRRTEKENYDLAIYVANWPDRRVYAWKQLMIARAIENQCYVAAVNRVGNDGNEIYHSGESAIIDYKGEKITSPSAGNEFIQTINLNYEKLQRFREQFAFFRDSDRFDLIS